MPTTRTRFERGTLWPAIVERTRAALARAALRPIATDVHVIPDRGVDFQVRVVSSLERRRRDTEVLWRRQKQSGERANPFLPYEEALFVADASATHVCLLNKYNVIDHHLLIITRDFEPQESPLTLNDFIALWECLAEYDALAFYNSAAAAGASQPHKHMQLVPLPLGPGMRLPIDPLLATAPATDRIVQAPGLPFAHAVVRLDAAHPGTAAETARAAYAHYLEMLRRNNLLGPGGLPAVLPPYNLLVTRQLMLLIPRTQGAFDSVPVNALGFVGSFFVPDEAAYQAIRRIGPLSLLEQVGKKPSGGAAFPA